MCILNKLNSMKGQTMSGEQAECLFVIIPELYDPDRGYELSTIWPGINGTFRTEFYCGHDLDLAIEWANELNMEKGHTAKFATHVLEEISGMNKVHFFDV